MAQPQQRSNAQSQWTRELVTVWMEAADRAEPLIAIVHRQRAERIARDRGVRDLVDVIVTAMQSAEPPPMNRIDVELPEGSVERAEALARSLVGTSWLDTVERVLSQGPPSGQFERNRTTALELEASSPLAALFPPVRLGSDGLPRFSARTEAERLDDQIVQIEVMHSRLLGAVFAETLVIAAGRFSPTAEQVAASVGGGAAADLFGRAVARFAAGDYEAAAYTALPLIERLARELLLLMDAPIYRLQRQQKPGSYAGLGVLLPLLAERGFDPSWHRFLRSFAASANGMNFRNEVMHGFVDDIGPLGASLVLISVYFLFGVALVEIDQEEEGGQQSNDS